MKMQEQLKTIRVLFKRLRMIYDKTNENAHSLQSHPIETMIPTKANLSDWKYADRKNTDQYHTALEERKELYDQIVVKNRHLQVNNLVPLYVGDKFYGYCGEKLFNSS